MIFQNYSQTFASNIVAFAGLASAMLALFGVDFIADAQLQFLIGTVLNFGGIVWSLYQRYKKGDVNALGFRL